MPGTVPAGRRITQGSFVFNVEAKNRDEKPAGESDDRDSAD